MAVHTDIPTRSEIENLLAVREPACVSIYVSTSPRKEDAQGGRIAFKSAVSDAVEQLRAVASEEDADAVKRSLEEFVDDDIFWAYQANSLAAFVTPHSLKTFRLPNQLTGAVQVADRFEVKPLLRTVTFPQAAFVLALAQGSVRLLEVAADVPVLEAEVPGLPKDAESAVGTETITDRAPSVHLQGDEGKKVRLRQYARQIDRALRPVLAGRDIPLILAAAQPLDSIYRSVNSYPHLAESGIGGNPEAVSFNELDGAARKILDELYAAELASLNDLFATRNPQGRSASDLTDVARAATYGAVDTALVDIDAHVPGTIDEESGVVSTDGGKLGAYDLVDEIARRVLLAHGRVLAVRASDIPGGGPVAAILRYAV